MIQVRRKTKKNLLLRIFAKSEKDAWSQGQLAAQECGGTQNVDNQTRRHDLSERENVDNQKVFVKSQKIERFSCKELETKTEILLPAAGVKEKSFAKLFKERKPFHAKLCKERKTWTTRNLRFRWEVMWSQLWTKRNLCQGRARAENGERNLMRFWLIPFHANRFAASALTEREKRKVWKTWRTKNRIFVKSAKS